MEASLLGVVFWLFGAFVSCIVLYCVIRLAIRHALREARIEERMARLAELQAPHDPGSPYGGPASQQRP